MNEPIAQLNAEQSELVTELVETYGIDPEEVLFFPDDPKPFLMYRATTALCNQLLLLKDIDTVPVQSVSENSLALKCSLIFDDGRARRAVGVVNFDEMIGGKAMTESQRYELASARAIRNALKNADVDLIKEHYQETRGEMLSFKVKSNYNTLLRQAHKLGEEKGLIVGEGKTLWYHELWSRYHVSNSNRLTEEQLADFVAFLNGYEPPAKKAA